MFQTSTALPAVNFSLLVPELLLVISACLLIFMDRTPARSNKPLLCGIALTTVLASIGWLCGLWSSSSSTLGGTFLLDQFAIFGKITLLIITALVILISRKFLQVERAEKGEFYGLVLLSAFGMLVMVSGGDLVSVYLGLETMTIAAYILTAYFRSEDRSSEAGLKYFLLGALNSGIILYGLALLYGATGSLIIRDIAASLSQAVSPLHPHLLNLAILVLVAGFGFKIAAVPFHMWAPDVYEGAPTPVTAFLSAGSKTASFAAIIRIFYVALNSQAPYWSNWFAYAAALTMVVGNLSALRQTNLKRLMAYSSIAQVGYMLMGLAAGSEMGATAILLYLFVYLFGNIGIFAALVLLAKEGTPRESLEDFSGLGRTRPALALAITFFLLSLSGVPPTGGFVGKFYLFMSAVKAKLMWLAVLGMVASVISLFYYMRVVMLMYIKEPARGDEEPPKIATSLGYSFCIMVFAIILTGIYPAPFLDLAQASFASLKIFI